MKKIFLIISLFILSNSIFAQGYEAFGRKSTIDVVVALGDSAAPALNAALGNYFTLSATGDRTIAVPTNPRSGQKIIIQHYASGGARTLALNTGAGGFAFGTDITALTATTSGKYDLIGAVFSASLNKWLVVSVIKGY